jgi:hypothetical protein
VTLFRIIRASGGGRPGGTTSLRLLDRDGLGSFKNAIDVGHSAADHVLEIRTVGQQSALLVICSAAQVMADLRAR